MGLLSRISPREKPATAGRPEYRWASEPTRATKKREPKNALWGLGAFGIVACMGAYASDRSFAPHVKRATREEILAVLPPELRTPEPRDSAAEARFTKIDSLIRERLPYSLVNDPKQKAEWDRRVAELTPVLKKIVGQGRLQAPPMDPTLDDPNAPYPVWWSNAFPREEIVLAAAKRGDRRFCIEDALWRIRLTEAYDNAGYQSGADWASGVPNLIYKVEMLGGYGPAGRSRILKELRPRDGRNPAAARRLLRQAREIVLPQIVAIGESGDPWHQPHFLPLLPSPNLTGKSPSVGILVLSTGKTDTKNPLELQAQRAGSFDPIDTARLMTTYVQAMTSDLQRPFAERAGLARTIRRPIWRRLRELSEARQPVTDTESYFQNLAWQDGMNRGHNTLGGELATSIRLTSNELAAAAYANLVRAVLSLRSGIEELPPDPYAYGKIRIDIKRRMVWSVSENGVDDGAAAEGYVSALGILPPDIVYRY